MTLPSTRRLLPSCHEPHLSSQVFLWVRRARFLIASLVCFRLANIPLQSSELPPQRHPPRKAKVSPAGLLCRYLPLGIVRAAKSALPLPLDPRLTHRVKMQPLARGFSSRSVLPSFEWHSKSHYNDLLAPEAHRKGSCSLRSSFWSDVCFDYVVSAAFSSECSQMSKRIVLWSMSMANDF